MRSIRVLRAAAAVATRTDEVEILTRAAGQFDAVGRSRKQMRTDGVEGREHVTCFLRAVFHVVFRSQVTGFALHAERNTFIDTILTLLRPQGANHLRHAVTAQFKVGGHALGMRLLQQTTQTDVQTPRRIFRQSRTARTVHDPVAKRPGRVAVRTGCVIRDQWPLVKRIDLVVIPVLRPQHMYDRHPFLVGNPVAEGQNDFRIPPLLVILKARIPYFFGRTDVILIIARTDCARDPVFHI